MKMLGGIGYILLLLGAGGMNDIPNRPIATAYILIGLALISIYNFFSKRKAIANNRPK